MITVGGHTVHDDMYLDQVNNRTLVSIDEKRSIGGAYIAEVTPITGGNKYTLGSQTLDNATQGIWYQQDIDALILIERAGSQIVVDYHGRVFNAFLIERNFSPMYQNEPDNPCKRFLGKITLLEI